MSQRQTLFVQNLPDTASNDRLEEIFSEIGPVKHCFVVNDKESGKCRGFGYVTFPMAEDAQRALNDVRDYDGHKIRVSIAKKKIVKKKGDPAPAPKTSPKSDKKPFKKIKKKARLIIRNLSFKCTEEDLRQVFGKYGTVLEVSIPLKPDGKMRGFAFVQLKNMVEASKAISGTNLKEIKGRPVAVDWAIAKDKFQGNQPSSSVKAEDVKPTVEDSAEVADETDGDTESDEEGGKAPKMAASKKTVLDKKPNQQSHHEEEGDDEDDEDGDDDDNDDDEDEEDQTDDSGSEKSDSDDGSNLSDGEEDEDDDDSLDDEHDEDAPVKKKPALPSDVDQGKTVFIRNLSFDTEEEELAEALSKFGELNYVRIVMHPDTETSKGVAFAQFKSKEMAEKCIEATQETAESGGIRLDGRRLNVVAAVSREDAVKLKDKKVKVQTGSRNLYLAREGLIRAGSKAAEGLSEVEMAKRARFEELKRAKLRDLNIFVSKTRLCVHNIPKSVDQKRLRALCLQAAGGNKAVRITECRVMYDRKPEKGQVIGQSLGYGFVEYRDHDHALKALRHLNNNPDIFGPQKRPIVEFSLEDQRKLKLKAQRRQQSKPPFQRKGEEKGGVKPSSGSSGQQGEPKQPQSNQRQQKKNRQKRKALESSAAGDGGRFSGFRTTAEVEQVELADGKKRRKVLPMPSKRGPKIRLRDKGKRPPVQPKTMKKGPMRKDKLVVLSRKDASQTSKKSAKSGKKFRRREDDRFESLVEQYKRKLLGGSAKNPVIKKTKWFSS